MPVGGSGGGKGGGGRRGRRITRTVAAQSMDRHNAAMQPSAFWRPARPTPAAPCTASRCGAAGCVCVCVGPHLVVVCACRYERPVRREGRGGNVKIVALHNGRPHGAQCTLSHVMRTHTGRQAGGDAGDDPGGRQAVHAERDSGGGGGGTQAPTAPSLPAAMLFGVWPAARFQVAGGGGGGGGATPPTRLLCCCCWEASYPPPQHPPAHPLAPACHQATGRGMAAGRVVNGQHPASHHPRSPYGPPPPPPPTTLPPGPRCRTCCFSTYVSDRHSHTSSCPSLAHPTGGGGGGGGGAGKEGSRCSRQGADACVVVARACWHGMAWRALR